MSTDRELLEAAARASGIGKYRYSEGRGIVHLGGCWNPLESDADALRLAVNLGISVYGDHATRVCEVGTKIFAELIEDDACEAARRAIVRAAAAIGEKM